VTSVALVPAGSAHIARATIAHHSKSFALASSLLGARIRDQTAVVYTWCRRADDAVDEHPDASAEDLVAVLGVLNAELDAAYAGTARDPVLVAFGEVARARAIPRHYPQELLAGLAMDAVPTRYMTVDHVLAYSWRVAGVVGLMMSHVFGVSDDDALIHAVHLGLGMQLTNICRDVAEDWERGRLYLPDELLAVHGAGGLAGELGRPLPQAAVAPIAATVRDLLALADRYYRSGDRGIRALPWRAALAVSAARRVYAAIGRRIARTGHDVTAGRAVVSKPTKIAHVAAAVTRIAVTSPRRLGSPRPRVPVRVLERSDVPQL
jgi:phytoene synthase